MPQSIPKNEPSQQRPSQQAGATGTEKGAQKPTDPELQNEGEGSRSGARRYDEKAERAAKDEKRVAELAEKAKKALEGPEGDALREAEERGKRAERP
ncbi:MAG: hypothetical protein M3O50_16090 [Myxococcota bacterium]|nr:hypothetical protein [Myxococcota bacterium]